MPELKRTLIFINHDNRVVGSRQYSQTGSIVPQIMADHMRREFGGAVPDVIIDINPFAEQQVKYYRLGSQYN